MSVVAISASCNYLCKIAHLNSSSKEINELVVYYTKLTFLIRRLPCASIAPPFFTSSSTVLTKEYLFMSSVKLRLHFIRCKNNYILQSKTNIYVRKFENLGKIVTSICSKTTVSKCSIRVLFDNHGWWKLHN